MCECMKIIVFLYKNMHTTLELKWRKEDVILTQS